MDYEKKYKEALDAAKSGKPIEEVFPELKESEDERIRRSIMLYLSNELYGVKQLTPRTNEIDSWFAWFEKQGEQKCRGCVNAKGCVTCVDEDQWEGVIPIFEVGDVMRTKEEAAKGLTDGMPVIVEIDNEKYRCTNEIIAIEDQYQYEYPPMNKQPAEWSDEDEKILGSIIKDYERANEDWDRVQRSIPFGAKINWLKSLRPQKQWKPTEKQMDALLTVLPYVRVSGDKVQNLLESLYNDLNKLI